MDPLSVVASAVGFKSIVDQMIRGLTALPPSQRPHGPFPGNMQTCSSILEVLIQMITKDGGDGFSDRGLQTIARQLNEALRVPALVTLSVETSDLRKSRTLGVVRSRASSIVQQWRALEPLFQVLNAILELYVQEAAVRVIKGDQYMQARPALNDVDNPLPELVAPEHTAFEKYCRGLASRQRRFIRKITFTRQPARVFTFAASRSADVNSSSSESRPGEISLDQWIQQFLRSTNQSSSATQASQSKAHFIFCNKHTDAASKHTISMSQDQYVAIMEACHLPRDFVVDLLTGTPVFKSTGKSDEARFLKYMIRMPLSQTNNWTVGIASNKTSRELYALLHGFSELERQNLMDALKEYESFTAQPLLLPLVLCDLLTENDSNEAKRHASDLWSVELRTVSLRLDDLLVSDVQAADDLEDLTRRVNAITSRLTFHEMRIKSCSKLLQTIRPEFDRYNRNNVMYGSDELSVSAMLLEILNRLEVDHETLLLEISCNQKIAASQLQILYNLAAQRDNRNNLKMAATSTKIARITQEDSFAMRTIAVMTIAFLPATAISSVFSMSMFNWFPDGNRSPVVSHYFWIYWVIAVCLTLAVIGIWVMWIHLHKQAEKQADGKELRLSAHDGAAIVSTNQTTNGWSPIGLMRRWLKSLESEEPKGYGQPTDVEKIARLPQDEAAASGTDVQHVVDVIGETSTVLPRAPTFVQGPTR